LHTPHTLLLFRYYYCVFPRTIGGSNAIFLPDADEATSMARRLD